jgi:hypothetical protein
MANDTSLQRPTAASIASYVKKNAAAVRKTQSAMHMSGSVREADYKGHHIVIRTTYDIRVDGVPLTGHLGVTDDGRVHYHAVPNVSFASAIDTVKEIIDVFPDDFTGRRRHGASGHDMGRMDMSSMDMGSKRTRSTRKSSKKMATGGRRKNARGRK